MLTESEESIRARAERLGGQLIEETLRSAAARSGRQNADLAPGFPENRSRSGCVPMTADHRARGGQPGLARCADIFPEQVETVIAALTADG